MNESFKDKGWLTQEYLTKGLSCGEIAAMCGTSRMEISRWLKKHGIPSRGRIDAVRNRFTKGRMEGNVTKTKVIFGYEKTFEEVTVSHTFTLLGRDFSSGRVQCSLCGSPMKIYFLVRRDDGLVYGVGKNCLGRVGLGYEHVRS
jgi:hypothetical protein